MMGKGNWWCTIHMAQVSYYSGWLLVHHPNIWAVVIMLFIIVSFLVVELEYSLGRSCQWTHFVSFYCILQSKLGPACWSIFEEDLNPNGKNLHQLLHHHHHSYCMVVFAFPYHPSVHHLMLAVTHFLNKGHIIVVLMWCCALWWFETWTALHHCHHHHYGCCCCCSSSSSCCCCCCCCCMWWFDQKLLLLWWLSSLLGSQMTTQISLSSSLLVNKIKCPEDPHHCKSSFRCPLVINHRPASRLSHAVVVAAAQKIRHGGQGPYEYPPSSLGDTEKDQFIVTCCCENCLSVYK